MNFRRVFVFIGLAFCLALVLPRSGLASGQNKQNLRGLKEVGLCVELMNPAIEHLGISRAQLQIEVENRLRQAGLKVLRQENLKPSSDLPLVYVNLAVRKLETMYAYSADMVCVISPRTNGSPATWTVGSSGLILELGEVRDKVTDLVNLFIKDFNSANGT